MPLFFKIEIDLVSLVNEDSIGKVGGVWLIFKLMIERTREPVINIRPFIRGWRSSSHHHLGFPPGATHVEPYGFCFVSNQSVLFVSTLRQTFGCSLSCSNIDYALR